jgi:serine/threonine-protein kinase
VVEEDDKPATIADGTPAFESDRDGALVGLDVGGYIVEGELGRGGMGVVYAATHPMIGKRVAIKVLKPSLSKDPATVERFIQEARSVNQIGHPNIVDIFAFGTLPDGRSYLIMDRLVGESLRKRIKRGALPVDDAVRILDEVAGALAAAHDKGFIHRDLKPDNVYLVEHGGTIDVKLLDFGLAKLLPQAGISGRAFRTATGAMLGTPDYMSPEQLKGEGVDHRTDIYALGIVGFEILAGERPRRYSDGSFELDGLTVTSFLHDRHAVPPALAELIEALVAPLLDRRPSLAAVRAVLKRVKNGQLEAVRALGTAPSLGTFGGPLGGSSGSSLADPLGGPFDARTTPEGTTLPLESLSPSPSVSSIGARQVVATPLSGSPTIPEVVPQVASVVSSAPSHIASRQPRYAPGLAKSPSSHPATKLGVAPPPERPSKPHPVAAARRGESKTWLVLGLVLVVGAAIALAVVLAT